MLRARGKPCKGERTAMERARAPSERCEQSLFRSRLPEASGPHQAKGAMTGLDPRGGRPRPGSATVVSMHWRLGEETGSIRRSGPYN